ncbi:MAG: N-acetylmuramoyl-L-alanine amidase [Lachnospiraceae bacterium]|nr:N-acetylmuramoyl-L-alanine amidase [Lachnospiraceae bacterium]
MKNVTTAVLVISLIILAGMIFMLFTVKGTFTARDKDSAEEQIWEEVGSEEREIAEDDLTPVAVSALETARISGGEIQVRWSDETDDRVSVYSVLRRDMSGENGDWSEVGNVISDGTAGDGDNIFSDVLEGSGLKQFEYRVDVEVSDKETCKSHEGAHSIRSNALICLDPGHYEGKNAVTGDDSYGYEENIATLKIGLSLRDLLEENYGISTVMTRETEHITIEGYSDEVLDSKHISLRGKYAEGCDYFISLHTNSNRDNANGYPTFGQPVSINKPVVLVGVPALQNETALAIANAIGQNISAVYENEGLCTVTGFETASPGNIREWSDAFNDGLDKCGAVCVRHGSSGDYYGILRGASEVGVPGLIVEHGFHSNAEVRREAMEGTLTDQWAAADAAGIAEGLGFSEIVG